MTTENSQHLEAIQDIRNMMKKSTRFLSLSGLSGVFAGIYALVGAYIAYLMLGEFAASFRDDVSRDAGMSVKERLFGLYVDYVLLAAAILVASILTAYVFSNRKAKEKVINYLIILLSEF